MEQEIHIKIEAFDCSRLEEYVRKFVREFKDKLKHSGTRLSGPVALPRSNLKLMLIDLLMLIKNLVNNLNGGLLSV